MVRFPKRTKYFCHTGNIQTRSETHITSYLSISGRGFFPPSVKWLDLWIPPITDLHLALRLKMTQAQISLPLMEFFLGGGGVHKDGFISNGIYLLFSGSSQNCEKRLLASSSVRPSLYTPSWNNSALDWKDFHEYWDLRTFQIYVKKFPLQTYKYNGYFTWRLMSFYDNISLNYSYNRKSSRQILCLFDRASSWELNKDRPTWCHLLYYFII